VPVRRDSLERAYGEADNEILASLRAFEETELLSVRPLFWAEDPHRPRRAKANAHAAWVFFLGKHLSDGAVQDILTAGEWYGRAVVPRWVNDLACALRTSQPEYRPNAASRSTDEQREIIRLVSRAVRAAERAPAFRIRLAADCADMRRNFGIFCVGGELPPATLGLAVVTWLRACDWTDARPGALQRSA
jgi:hypothetical protein